VNIVIALRTDHRPGNGYQIGVMPAHSAGGIII
jgi:hypothetical protein